MEQQLQTDTSEDLLTSLMSRLANCDDEAAGSSANLHLNRSQSLREPNSCLLSSPAPALADIRSGQRKQIQAALQPVPEAIHTALSEIVDTHCHLVMDDRWLEAAPKLRAKQYCVVTVEEADWEELPQEGPANCCLGFGVHPQCAMVDRSATWKNQLEQKLELAPMSFVGECGFDKNARHRFSFESGDQQEVFQGQLETAAKMGRCVSVHCLKAHDDMLKQMAIAKKQQCLPHSIAMHSFNGSLQFALKLLKLLDDQCHMFFGFAAWTNLQKKDAAELLQGIPSDRLLLESDWTPIDFDFDGSDPRHVDKVLLNGALIMSRHLGMTAIEVARLTTKNAMQCFSVVNVLSTFSDFTPNVTTFDRSGIEQDSRDDEDALSDGSDDLHDSELVRLQELATRIVEEVQCENDTASSTEANLAMWNALEELSSLTPWSRCYTFLCCTFPDGKYLPLGNRGAALRQAVAAGGRKSLLSALEKVVRVDKRTWPLLLKDLYDAEVLMDRDFLQHYRRFDFGDNSFAIAKTAARPFLDWLEQSESEEDEEDSLVEAEDGDAEEEEQGEWTCQCGISRRRRNIVFVKEEVTEEETLQCLQCDMGDGCLENQHIVISNQ